MNNVGFYLKKYLKRNAVVLLCELAVVLLLSLICSMLLQASPAWLAPTLAVIAYFIAELRYVMAFISTKLRPKQDADEEDTAEAEEPAAAPAEVEPQAVEQPEDEQAEDETPAAAPVAPVEEPTLPEKGEIAMDDEDDEVAVEALEMPQSPAPAAAEATAAPARETLDIGEI